MTFKFRASKWETQVCCRPKPKLCLERWGMILSLKCIFSDKLSLHQVIHRFPSPTPPIKPCLYSNLFVLKSSNLYSEMVHALCCGEGDLGALGWFSCTPLLSEGFCNGEFQGQAEGEGKGEWTGKHISNMKPFFSPFPFPISLHHRDVIEHENSKNRRLLC